MLPKKYRLLADYDFRRLRRLGLPYRSLLFTLVVASAKPGQLRIGFVISNKVDKRATARNRVKRLLREAVQQKLPVLKTGFDAAFYIRPSCLTKSYAEVCTEVNQVLSKTPLFQ